MSDDDDIVVLGERRGSESRPDHHSSHARSRSPRDYDYRRDESLYEASHMTRPPPPLGFDLRHRLNRRRDREEMPIADAYDPRSDRNDYFSDSPPRRERFNDSPRRDRSRSRSPHWDRRPRHRSEVNYFSDSRYAETHGSNRQMNRQEHTDRIGQNGGNTEWNGRVDDFLQNIGVASRPQAYQGYASSAPATFSFHQYDSQTTGYSSTGLYTDIYASQYPTTSSVGGGDYAHYYNSANKDVHRQEAENSERDTEVSVGPKEICVSLCEENYLQSEVLKPGNYLGVVCCLFSIGEGVQKEIFQMGCSSHLGEDFCEFLVPQSNNEEQVANSKQGSVNVTVSKVTNRLVAKRTSLPVEYPMKSQKDGFDAFLQYLERNRTKTRPFYDGVVLLLSQEGDLELLLRFIRYHDLTDKFWNTVCAVGTFYNFVYTNVREHPSFHTLPTSLVSLYKQPQDPISENLLKVAYCVVSKEIANARHRTQDELSQCWLKVLTDLAGSNLSYGNFFRDRCFPKRSKELYQVLQKARDRTELIELFAPLERYLTQHLTDNGAMRDRRIPAISDLVEDVILLFLNANFHVEKILHLQAVQGKDHVKLKIRSILLQAMLGKSKAHVGILLECEKIITKYFTEQGNPSILQARKRAFIKIRDWHQVYDREYEHFFNHLKRMCMQGWPEVECNFVRNCILFGLKEDNRSLGEWLDLLRACKTQKFDYMRSSSSFRSLNTIFNNVYNFILEYSAIFSAK